MSLSVNATGGYCKWKVGINFPTYKWGRLWIVQDEYTSNYSGIINISGGTLTTVLKAATLSDTAAETDPYPPEQLLMPPTGTTSTSPMTATATPNTRPATQTSSTTTSGADGSQTASPNHKADGLSTGVKVAIGVCAPLATIAIVAAAFFAGHWASNKKKKDKEKPALAVQTFEDSKSATELDSDTHYELWTSAHTAEMEGRWDKPHELHGARPVKIQELQG